MSRRFSVFSFPGPDPQQGLEDDPSAANGHAATANGAKSSNDLQRARYFVFEQVGSLTE